MSTSLSALPAEDKVGIIEYLDLPSLARLGQTDKCFKVLTDIPWPKIAQAIYLPSGQGNLIPRVRNFVEELYAKGKESEDYRIEDILAQPKTIENVNLLQRYLKARDVIIVWNGDSSLLDQLKTRQDVLAEADKFPAYFNQNRLQLINSIQALNFEGKKLTHIPEEIFELTVLRRLNLNGNLLSELPTKIRHLDLLEYLDLNNNRLKSIPEEIDHCHNLRELNLSNNHLSSLPAKFQGLYSLDKLDLSHNRFSVVPPQICRLALKRLDLSHNQLQVLPYQYGFFSHLKALSLSYNQFRAVPPEICHLPLAILDLSYNQIQALPRSLANSKTLEKLDLCHNGLRELFPKIGKMQSLNWLCLSHNKLTSLPQQITNLSLDYLDIEENAITRLPHTQQQLRQMNRIFFEGNPLPLKTRCALVALYDWRDTQLTRNKLLTHRASIGIAVSISGIVTCAFKSLLDSYGIDSDQALINFAAQQSQFFML